MHTEYPMLSIITVNYNNNIGLIKTLESIKKQTFSSYEHIIIDANSTDGSKETILAYEKETEHLTFWCSESDKGIYDGMNKGIEKAKGKYLYFLNSGDALIDNNILNNIPFDGTQYIYGDTIMQTLHKRERWTYPDVPDFIFLSNNSLAHQASFIHYSLFEHNKYDINYKIVSDWAHCIQSILLRNCSYKYTRMIISECDGNGISSNSKALKEERLKWAQENLPKPIANSLIECSYYERSPFRSIIPLLSRTKQFQKRAKRIVLFLYRINKWFSSS